MTARTDIQRVSGTSRPSDKLNGVETMKTETKTETYAPHPLVMMERHPRSNAEIADAANSRNDSDLPSLSADSDRDSLLVWLESHLDSDADLDDLTSGEAWDRLDAILATTETETETETETCSDCGGTSLRLDTTTGAVDCVDCGNETETETETETRARSKASDAYHDDPRHASSCWAYEEHARDTGRNNHRCPCENNWEAHIAGEA